MRKIKVGDRVRASCKHTGIRGLPKGTVRVVNGSSIGVEFDAPFSGHNLGGKISSGRGWWDSHSELIVSEDKKCAQTCIQYVVSYTTGISSHVLIFPNRRETIVWVRRTGKDLAFRDAVRIFEVSGEFKPLYTTKVALKKVIN
jgi:hypothetical protein